MINILVDFYIANIDHYAQIAMKTVNLSGIFILKAKTQIFLI